MRTELCWLDDVEIRPAEERPLDDAQCDKLDQWTIPATVDGQFITLNIHPRVQRDRQRVARVHLHAYRALLA